MIRFCDKEVFVITEEEMAQISRRDLLNFFLEEWNYSGNSCNSRKK